MMRPSANTVDASVVTLAANHLDVSEFEIFRASYKSWYSDDGSDALLEHHFGAYLKHGDVPCWVRHFSRERLSEERDDEWSRGDLLVALELIKALYSPVGECALNAGTFAISA